MIQLTDQDGRLITLHVIYEIGGSLGANGREAEQSVLRMLQTAPSGLFNTLPTIVPHQLP